jgi:hypothetical protein
MYYIKMEIGFTAADRKSVLVDRYPCYLEIVLWIDVAVAFLTGDDFRETELAVRDLIPGLVHHSGATTKDR